MATKDSVLALFEKNKGIYISGEEIADNLHISRTAVWKAVKKLREEGYHIDAVQNKGYSLSMNTDVLSVQGIQKYLKPGIPWLKTEIFADIDSTNAIVKAKAADGAQEGIVILANGQTNGKGRVGRNFYSPVDTGIYLSVLLRPKCCTAQEALKYTIIAAVSACQAIEKISEETAMIKWVNDIYINEKKVGGILTEGSLSIENGFMDYLVMGIGLNVYSPKNGFPEEIAETAGAIFKKQQNDGKNRLAAEFLNYFMSYYTEQDNLKYTELYRKKSLAIGKKIKVYKNGKSQNAIGIDVDQECRLIVKYENGKTDSLSSGEISIRFS